MGKEITIFGKHTWPYTQKAREAKSQEGYEVKYLDVVAEPQHMEDMLKFSQGVRQVPVLVEGEKVSIGFGGTWKVWRACGLQALRPYCRRRLPARVAAKASIHY